jgi:hypothetical protein
MGEQISDAARIKSELFLILSDLTTSVASIYTSHVRPASDSALQLSVFGFTPDELKSLPPTPVKPRVYLYQLLLELDLASHRGCTDPLPDEVYRPLSRLLRSISPLTLAFGPEFLIGMLEELHSVHSDEFPETMARLEEDLGLSDRDDVIGGQPIAERRIHYQDDRSDPNQGSSARNGSTMKLNIKKSVHGPDPVKLFSFGRE